jgi:hypothetical protein
LAERNRESVLSLGRIMRARVVRGDLVITGDAANNDIRIEPGQGFAVVWFRRMRYHNQTISRGVIFGAGAWIG